VTKHNQMSRFHTPNTDTKYNILSYKTKSNKQRDSTYKAL